MDVSKGFGNITGPRYLVVNVAVGEHGCEVVDTFLGIPVVMVFKPFLDCSHVHRIFDNIVVVLEEIEGM